MKAPVVAADLLPALASRAETRASAMPARARSRQVLVHLRENADPG
jgi:hypothetical protein